MAEIKKYDPPSETAWDHMHTLAHAGISVIPLISGPTTELFGMIVATPLKKRQAEWMERMPERFAILKRDKRG